MVRRRYLLFTKNPADREQEDPYNALSEVEALWDCQSSLK